MKIRWGNIDLVEISDVELPFTQEQCRVLSKPSCAKIFMRLKNKQLLSKPKLLAGMGVSESTFNKALLELQKENLVVRVNNNYRRSVEFRFPKVIITGYEAKLTDYNKALFQARMNKQYVDFSYMVFPMDVAEATGMAAPNIARIESCKRIPTMQVLAKYADAVGMKIEIDVVSVSQEDNKD